jgi:putative tricarboxylic transport membrane protein
MSRVKDLNLVLTGSFLIGVALLAFYGYVPRLFAFLQLGLGALMVFNGFVQEGEPTEPWHLRPLVLVLASVAFFAFSIERMGLVVSVTGLVLISCAAHRGTTWREALALAVGASVVSVLLFVKLLGLTMPVWPPLPWSS